MKRTPLILFLFLVLFLEKSFALTNEDAAQVLKVQGYVPPDALENLLKLNSGL